jgi:serine/threonine protein phosphatase PrpC
MRLQIRAITDKGRVREQNEDRVLLGTELLREGLREVEVELAEDSRYVMGIADGMKKILRRGGWVLLWRVCCCTRAGSTT